jgi:hypothetical protein
MNLGSNIFCILCNCSDLGIQEKKNIMGKEQVKEIDNIEDNMEDYVKIPLHGSIHRQYLQLNSF